MTSAAYQQKITGVILAGGGGRRMGGRDKGLIPLRGRPLIAHVIERLRPQCETLLINCQRSHQQYAEYGFPLIGDSLPGGLGPLAGLLAGMEQVGSGYVLIAPCDTPFLPHDLVTRMGQMLAQQNAQVCSVSDGERSHPVIMLADCGLKSDLRDYLLAGERRVQHWFRSQRHCLADFSDQANAFININTPEQLDDATQVTPGG